MSILDAQLIFSDGQDISSITAGGNSDSTNDIDITEYTNKTGTATNDRPNVSGRLNLNVTVGSTALTAASDGATLTIALFADTDATTISTDGTEILRRQVTVNSSAVSGSTSAGSVLMSVPLPTERFGAHLIVNYAVATQNMAGGTVNAWLGPPCYSGDE